MQANLTIKHSEQINEIASALAKAQGEMKPAVFNRLNPHYKSRYADFASCMDACRMPLSKNALAVSQLPTFTDDGKFVLNTLLIHASGQWMACEFPLNSKNADNIQALGSVMSYAKRYSLCGMLGIVADEEGDDDGEAACGRVIPPKALSQEKISKLNEVLSKCDPQYVRKIDKELENQKRSRSNLTEELYEKILYAASVKAKEYQDFILSQDSQKGEV